jgi:hypothetical protein
MAGSKKCVLLLVSQHLYGGFAQYREVERWTLRGSIGKHELVSERRLAASRGSSDDVEGKFREPATHNFVEARNSGG